FAGQGSVTGGTLRLNSTGATTGLFVNGNATLSGSLFGNGTATSNNVITGSTGSTLTIDSIFFTSINELGGGALNLVIEGSVSGGLSPTMTIQPLATCVFNQNSVLTASRTVNLAGAGSFTLNGTIALVQNTSNLPSSLTKDAGATLTNYHAPSGTLTGGRYMLLNLDGATVDLGVGPIRVNAAEIELVRSTAVFTGLDALASNPGKLVFNRKNFTLAGGFDNAGSMTVSGAIFTVPGAVTNSGAFLLSALGNTTTLTIGTGYTQSAGTLNLGVGNAPRPTVSSGTGVFTINGGRLEGDGTLTGNVHVSGTISPSVSNGNYGRLNITGTLQLSGSSTTEIRVGTASFSREADLISATGATTLAGELKVYIATIGDPDPTRTFSVLGGASVTGAFSNVTTGQRLRTADGRGSFLVTINSNSVQLSAYQATPARALGLAVTGAFVGTVYTRFGAPAQGPFGGSLKFGKTTVVAIFAGDGSVRAEVNGDTPILGETVYSKLGEPSGDAALATVKGTSGVTAKNDQVLLGSLINGPVRIAVREGVTEVDGLPGVTVKTFLTIESSPNAGVPIFFRAMLQGGTTTTKDDMALCAALPDGTLRVLVREGQQLVPGGKKVTIIGTLVAAPASLGEGRWRAGDDALGVRLSFVGGSSAIYAIPVTATTPAQWELALDTETALGAPLAGVKVVSLGLPGFGAQSVAFLAQLKVTPNLVKSTDDQVLFISDDNGLSIVAREGDDAAGVDGGKYKTFSDPVSGSDGGLAVLGTAKSGSATISCLWRALPGQPLELVKCVGNDAPGGGKFASFTSIALPDGPSSGPIFTAKLASSKVPLISTTNNFGIWAVGSSGSVVKLLRTGDTIRFNGEDRVVKTFTTLVSAAGSIGAARGYDNAGNVTVLATFVPKKVNNIALTASGLVQLTVP
ncbi:MAG: hypothetical protein V4773_27380, partial [Verrucomicrobiota bacterium]